MFSRLNVRTKLLVMLLPAVVGLCGLAGLGVKTRLDDRSSAQLTRDASDVAVSASAFVHRLQMERVAASAAAAAPSAELDSMLADQVTATDLSVDQLNQVLSSRTGGLDEGTAAADVAALRRGVDRVARTRAAGTTAAANSEAFSQLIDSQLAAIGRLELVGGDGAGNTTSRRWLAAGIEAESNAAAVAAGLLSTDLTDGDRADTAATAQELVERAGLFYDTYNDYAGPEGVAQFKEAREAVGSLATDEYFDELAGPDAATTFAPDTDTWPGLVRARLSAVESVETASYGTDIATFAAAASAADSSVVYFAAGAAGSCLLVILLAFGISRHITSNLRRLRDAAREISDEQVPALVHSLKSGTGVLGVRLTEVETGTDDELADVGHALNELGRAMVAVATEQQQSLRKGISDIFVNLARRNQTLLDRQIQFIDRLEANEQDPDQLENLFRLDHLATRMRRNAESLLVLAGAEAPRRRARDVELSDVIRVAVGEVEDFARISLVAVEESEAVGSVAVDIAHLLAELMENGAQYSPPERTVDIIGHRSADGGYVISITDHGVGMSADRLESANRLLASPPPVGLALTRALGFVVAGTLANRHAIRVHLSASPSGGVTAEVTLPAAVVRTPDGAGLDAAPGGRPEMVPSATLPEILAPAPGSGAPAAFAPGFVPGAPLQTRRPATGDPVGPAPSRSGSNPATAPTAPMAPTAVPFPVAQLATTEVTAGWNAKGEYVSAAFESTGPDAARQPEPEHYEPFVPWQPTDSISWSEERLPTAPAPSKLVDMLPEGPAFEQGLYSLLGEDAPPSPAASSPQGFPPAAGPPSVATPPGPSSLPSSLPSFGDRFADQFGDLSGDLFAGRPPAYEPPANPANPAESTGPSIPGLWAAPIVHPRPPSAGSPVAPGAAAASAAPLLPQRSPGAGPLAPMTEPADRSAAPQRPADEVRSVLSRYRSGLDNGRSAPGGTAEPTEPTSPAGPRTNPDPHTIDESGASER